MTDDKKPRIQNDTAKDEIETVCTKLQQLADLIDDTDFDTDHGIDFSVLHQAQRLLRRRDSTGHADLVARLRRYRAQTDPDLHSLRNILEEAADAFERRARLEQPNSALYEEVSSELPEEGMSAVLTPEVIKRLLKSSDDQLDASMHTLIRAWSKPPTALQILEVIDQCIFSALASGFVIRLLQLGYDDACKREETTHEEVIKSATWRGVSAKDTGGEK